MAKKGTCWMCGRVGPLTLEHAFPDWVRKIFATDGYDISLSDHRAGMTQRARTWTNQSGQVTVRNVCSVCNNGWMSELEARCQPDLQPLIIGHKPPLPLAAQATLAVWAVKTAWVFQSMNPRTSVCTIQQRRDLSATQTLPTSVRVFLGAFQEAGDNVVCTHWYVAGSSEAARVEPDTSVSTLVVGRVILQVIQWPEAETYSKPAWQHPDQRMVSLSPATKQPLSSALPPVYGEGELEHVKSPLPFSTRTWDPLPAITPP